MKRSDERRLSLGEDLVQASCGVLKCLIFDIVF